MTSRQNHNRSKLFRWSNPLAWGIVLTVLFVGIMVWLSLNRTCSISGVCENNFQKFIASPPNEMGDALAGLAGSLAFLWIIITVLLQYQELRAQREELVEQRKEAVKSNENMAYQRFENTFFSMLSTYNEIVSSIDLVKKGSGPNVVTTTGKDCFKTFYNRLSSKFSRYKNNPDALETAYMLFWNDNNSELGHYFRFLYRAFLVIGENEHAQTYHGKILRALLSDQELILIFYNCLSQHGGNFKSVASKFRLFDNMPTNLLFDESHALLMPKEAFGQNPEYKKFIERLNP